MFGWLKKRGSIFKITEQKNIELESIRSRIGIIPPIDFETLYKVFTKDPDLYTAALSISMLTVGPGFFTESEDAAAKEAIDNFCENVGMDELLFTVVTELVWAGNSFWLKVRDGKSLIDLQHIPPTYVTRLFPTETGEPKELEILANGKLIKVPYPEIVHFYLFKVDREFFGSPLTRALVEYRVDSNGNPIPPFYQILWDIEKSMHKVIQKYPPRVLWSFPDISDEKLRDEYEPVIRNLQPGEDVVTNVKAEIKDVSADPRSRFTEYIQHLEDKKIVSVISILHRLFTTPGFTEASARIAKEVQDNLISAIQRKIKRTVERQIFAEITKSPVRLNWGFPKKPELRFDDILRAAYAPNVYNTPLITQKEARAILRDLGWPLEQSEEE